MRILFLAYHTQHISVLLDEAISLSHAGNEIIFLYNGCCSGICSGNMWKSSIACELCHIKFKKALKILPNKIRTINIHEYMENKQYHFQYNTIQDIKKIEHKGVKVGYSVLSSYFSGTRNLYPLINDDSKQYFDELLNASCHLIDAFDIAIHELKPESIYFWNSRYFDSRPAFDLAKLYGIKAVSMERTNDVGVRNVKRRFVNHTPHDILYNDELHNKVWNEAPLSLDEKEKIGRGFFEKRRNGIAAGDKVYIGNQQKGLLPQDWDPSKRNIVIFNSSEDEFAAIGDEYDKLALFPTQYKGIKFILDTFKNDPSTHVYLRIHPNLANIKYRYHTELINLVNIYENLTVIRASDIISTYDLMEAAEKVVVFGSTMGLESAYWGKPVILLAGALYYYSNLCYIPNTEAELYRMLYAQLPPRGNIEAIKWGFYILYRNYQDIATYVDIDSHWFHVGKHKWQDVHYLKLLGSSKLFAVYYKMLAKHYRKTETWGHVPTEEDINAEL